MKKSIAFLPFLVKISVKAGQLTSIFFLLLLLVSSCKKEHERDNASGLRYFEVGMHHTPQDWRDSSFIVATKDPQLIEQIEQQLILPMPQRRIVSGALVAGDGGYNKNATHSFKWHFKEDDWTLTDVAAEIHDGRPYSDIDLHFDYWMNTVTRYSPWGSYIRKEIKR